MRQKARTDPRAALGRAGEDRARRSYVEQGFTVLDHNWRSSEREVGGELDLVVHRPGIVVFAEVKTRSDDRFGEPFEAVTPAKQRRIRRLSVQWLRERGAQLGVSATEIRFDVVSIRGATMEILEAAF